MQYVTRYNVKHDKAQAYRAWLRENEQTFREHAPVGWQYLGTWFTVHGLGTHSAESRWELQDYAAFDARSGGDEVDQRLTREWFQFIDDSRDWHSALMKDAVEERSSEADDAG